MASVGMGYSDCNFTGRNGGHGRMRSCRGQSERDGLKERVLLRSRCGLQEVIWPLGETQKDKGCPGFSIRRNKKRRGPYGFLKL